MGDRGDEAQFVYDQQVQPEKLPLQVEQTPLVPGLQRSTLTPPFTCLVFTDATPQPVYFSTMALLDHWICRMVTEAGAPARASPSRRSWLETALFTAPAGNPHHLCLSGWLENPALFLLAGRHTFAHSSHHDCGKLGW